MYIDEVWICVEAFAENVIENWRMTRAIAFNVARWSGNMKHPNQSQHAFWPLPGDEEGGGQDKFTKMARIARMRKKAEEVRKNIQ